MEGKKQRVEESATRMTLRRHTMTRQLEPSASINSLPQEVLLHVFSFLTLGEVCNSVSKVCTHWNRLHWDPQLYRSPKMNPDEETTQDLFKSLKVAPKLESRFHNRVTITKIIKKSFDFYCKRRRFNKFVHVIHKDLCIMLPHLHTVHLVHMSNRCSLSVTSLLSCCLQLEELKVFDNKDMTITNDDLIALCSQLCRTLRVLHLDCEDWTLNGVHALRKCSRLEDLALLEARDLSADCLLAMGNMSHLRRLKIQFCFEPSVEVWTRMFANPSLRRLTSLTLHDCSFTDTVAVGIGTNLRNLTELSLLKRISCHPSTKRYVGRKGMESIIKGCNKLEILEIDWGGIYPIAKIIMLIPEYLPGLKRLFALCLPFSTFKWKSAVKEKMPHLIIRERWSKVWA